MSEHGAEGHGAEGQDLVGKTLAGRYEVKHLLGRGGMGAVYEATQLPLGRKVALKVIRRALSDDALAVKRFTKEAQAVSQLSHPNIVTLFDFGQTDDGVLYIAMEFLEGQSLRDALRAGPLPWARSLVVVAEILRALVEAHEKGIIHRDLKPDNVMLVGARGKERVKVVDFGVAKLTDPGAAHSTMTGTGMVVGTPGYISPEQVNGVSDDARSDLYALGVMWFELLTARPPFEGETPMKVVLKHMHEPAPRPSTLAASSIPREIDALVQRLLAKSPEARAPSAARLLDEVEGLIARTSLLEVEVATGALSSEEIARARAHATTPEAPMPAPIPVPFSVVPTPATFPRGAPAPITSGAVVEGAPRKRRGMSPALLGCLVIPGSLFALGLSCAMCIGVKNMTGPNSPVISASFRDDEGDDEGDDGDEQGEGFAQVAAAAAAARAAVERGGDGDEREGAGGEEGSNLEVHSLEAAGVGVGLYVALKGIDKIGDADARRAALRAYIDNVDRELEQKDLSDDKRRVLEELRKEANQRRRAEKGRHRSSSGGGGGGGGGG